MKSEKSKNIIKKFIYSLGIRFIGEINSEILANDFQNINNFIQFINDKDRLENIDGLGPKAISSLLEYFENRENLETIKQLNKVLKIYYKTRKDLNNFFNGKNLVLAVLYHHYQG